MRTSFFKILAITTIIAFTSCADKAKEADTKAAKEASEAEVTAITYKADLENSIIEWTGFKPTGSHSGTMAIANGTVNVNEGAIESGNFIIDMNSLTVTDIPKEKPGNAKLTGHLKNEDFFDVVTYPNAKFEITDTKTIDGKTMLSGNLTMKNTTNNITFPVTTEVHDDKMTLTSETFTIDRSKWNIEYKSKSFFNDLEDKFINDNIELKVTLVANQ